jgi:hypothetical protein
MNIATLQGERTLTDLVGRLYQVPDGGLLSWLLCQSTRETEALVKKAEDALRRANPILVNLGALPPGTVIVVPEVEGLKHTRDVRAVRSPADSLLAGLVESTKEVLDGVERAMEERMKELKDLLAVFESGEVKPLHFFDAFPAALKATKEEAGTLAQELPVVKELHKRTLTQLKADVAAMAKIHT